MALDNSTKELLSGYLDNQLNADDLSKVEVALADPEVQAYFQSLQEIRANLKALSAVSAPGLPPDFAQRVLAAVAAQAGPSLAQPDVWDTAPSRRRGKLSSWAIGLAGLAAAISMAVWIPKAFFDDEAPQPFAGPLSVDSQLPIDDPNIESAPKGQLVRRGDMAINYIMTLDVELGPGVNIRNTLSPLLQAHNIELIKGAKAEGDIKKALDNIRVTLPSEGEVLPTEVYLLRASSTSLDTVLEIMRADLLTYPVLRFGLAYELPSDPLLDQLSLGGDKQGELSIALSQAIADSLSNNVDPEKEFAAPLVDQEFRPSPFEAIPHQGKLVGSSNRASRSAISAIGTTGSGKGQFSFLLLFIRPPL
jgi:hypothetical protein